MNKYLLITPILMLLVPFLSSDQQRVYADNSQILGVEERIETGFLPLAEDKDSAFFVTGDFDNYPQKINNIVLPKTNAQAYFLFEPERDYVFCQMNADVILPIASISKLMTALVFLDNNPGWDEVYKISAIDRVDGGKIFLYKGDQLKVKNLFNLSLVASANTATKALSLSTGLSEEAFIVKMNKKARELGMVNTSFVEPTGISQQNVSTAKEVATMVEFALSVPDIAQALQSDKYVFYTLAEQKKIAYSTNMLLDNYPSNGVEILGGKTGYTESAGYCFAAKFVRSGEKNIISVVLGENNIDARFFATQNLVNWTYDNFVWGG